MAVDRRFKREGDQGTDFISCVSFGKAGEFAEKYLRKGIKIAISGRIQTGSYTNKEGRKVYTTDVVVEEQEFAESKNANRNQDSNTKNQEPKSSSSMNTSSDGFMSIPDYEMEGLPFS